MSFFVSSTLEGLIDEKTYLSQEDNDTTSMFVFKSDKSMLFSKKNFEVINFNKKSKIKSIDFFLNNEEVNAVLFRKKITIEINTLESKKQTYHFKILKIAKLDHNKYYCQVKALGETHD